MSDLETNAPEKIGRRKFLTASAATAAGAAIAPGVLLHTVAEAKPAGQAVSSKNRWGMLIDTNKCSKGCNACVSACNEENGLEKSDHPNSNEIDAQWIRKVELKDKSTGHSVSLPLMCQHCEHPPCVDVCPTGASMKREDGIVLVDKHICIGCRYCMMACPYKARSFVHEAITNQKEYSPRGKGTVESCTLCVHRIDKGEIPACAEACPEKAILFGNLNDANSDIAKRMTAEASTEIRGDLRLDLGVRYQGI
ncbi:MAG: 4Fe-4S dicluster domain-containing protein [Gammaproteobacteria bacterium]|nr:4Fe-4S dicluster domain-containing protein [Gammaproteobacteria bacterium]